MPQIIESFDNSGEALVVRFPTVAGSVALELGSQLIVQEGQVGVLFRDGRALDGFRAGRHVLDTANLPMLGQLMAGPWGKSPFTAAVYFIALKTFSGRGWGTAAPITLRDADFGNAPIRAYGTYSFRVTKPRTLLNTLVGTKGYHDLGEYDAMFRSLIVSRLNKVLATNQTSILDLPARTDDIAIELRQACAPDFEQYGLEVVDLLIENFSLPPAVQARIEQNAGNMAIKDVHRNIAIAQADALVNASLNPDGGAGAGLAAGLGVAFGMGMAGTASGAAIPGAAPPPVAHAPPVDVMAEARRKLTELKAMHEEGLIDVDEYRASKSEILKRIK